MHAINIPAGKLSDLLFRDTRSAWLWLIIRIYLGYEWFMAGWEKIWNPAWTGSDAGKAVSGFLNGALAKTTGAHPDVSWWYASFIQNIALPNAEIFSYLVVFGELFVGLGLILGILTGISAFFASFMNFNYLFAGTISSNPIMIFLQFFLILGWRTAGYIGLDRYILPKIGNPWELSWISGKNKNASK